MLSRHPTALPPAAFVSSAIALMLLACQPLPVLAQLPATRLASIFPAGGNPGKTVDVTIAGVDLDDTDRLHFSRPGISAQQKMAEPGPFDSAPQPVPNQFVVTIAANVPVGLYDVRVAGKYGLSNTRAFAVSDLPEVVETEPNDAADTAAEVETPVVVNGRCDRAGDVDYFRFTAAAAQRMIIRCQARQIDSKIDAVVVVYDASGREIDSSRDGHQGDPLVDLTAQAGATYTIKVYGALHKGGDGCVYRLAVGSLPHIDYVFPPAGVAGGSRPFTVFGRNLPGGQSAGTTVDGKPLQKVNASISLPGGAAAQAVTYDSLLDPFSGGVDATQYRVKNQLGSSNPVLVGVAGSPPVIESEPNNTPETAQQVVAGCEVMGQFFPQRDDDWFRFDAKQDETFTIEVISQRMGVAANPAIVVQQVIEPAEVGQPPQVKQIALANESGNFDAGPDFDTRNDDPVHIFTTPADGTYRVLVRDGRNALQADPRQVYRLAIRKSQPDFRLVAVPEDSHSAVLLRKGGQAAIRVVAFRRDGFDGEIKVTATNLPAGVTCHDAVIGPARSAAALVLTAAPTAAPADGLIQIVGTAQVGTAPVTRPARFGTALRPLPPRIGNVQPPTDGRITRNLAVSVSAEAAPALVQAGGGQVWEVSRAGIVKIPYTRSGPFTGKINFSPRDLPANIDVAVFSANPNVNSGEFELKLKNNTPAGTYTFYLDAIAEKYKYERNPEAAAAAAQRKQEVDKIHAEATAAAKTAADGKAAADKLATDTAAASQAALTAKQAADTALTEANVATAGTADRAAQAKALAAKDPENAALATAAAEAQRMADEAATAAQLAMTNATAAQTALDDANAKAKAAVDAKAEADTKAAEADERAKAATELKTKIDKLATDTAEAAKPKDVNAPLVSTPVTLKITPAPVTLAVQQPAAPLKQGEKFEAVVTIQRLYSYNGAVTVSASLPTGVTGLSVPNASIAAGQTQTKLAVTAASNATVGQHTLTVRATLSLNGQSLTVEQPMTINVQPAPPAT